MMTVIVVLTIVLTVAVVPLGATIEVRADVFGNSFGIDAALFGMVPLFSRTASFRGGADGVVLAVSHGKKTARYRVTAEKSDDSIMKPLSSGFVPYIDIVEIDLDLTVGRRDDACFSALFLAFLRSAVCAGLAALTVSQKVKIRDRFECVFDRDVLIVEAFGIITVSVADIIYGFLLHICGKKRQRSKKK